MPSIMIGTPSIIGTGVGVGGSGVGVAQSALIVVVETVGFTKTVRQPAASESPGCNVTIYCAA